MEDQCGPLSWDFFHEEERMEEYFWHSLLHKTIELETRVASAKDELVKKDDELAHVKSFLSRALRERDEAESKSQTLFLDIVALRRQLPKQTQIDPVDQPRVDPPAPEMALPEKGKLLSAVMEAGPLLQTLLIAGALPQWHKPPSRLDAGEIPPVIVSCLRRKRSLEGSDLPSDAKCLKG